MDFSIVMPVRNVSATLREQLDALVQQECTCSWEVVIVNNRSTDDTAEIVHEYAAKHPRIRMITADDGSGVNFGRNRGIEGARSELVALCDGDDIVGPRWVQAMYDGLQHHEVMTGPIDAALLNPAWLVHTRGLFPTDRPRAYFGIFPLAAGGNMAIRRSTWRRVGRFREDIVGAVDDIEFSLRLWQANVEIGFALDAVIHYRYRSEPISLWRHGRFYGKGKPLICKMLHEANLPTPARFAGWKSWALVILWLPRVFTLQGRAAWCWVAGNRIGQLEGCLHYRTLWL